jgi:hypothetical protein
LGLKRIKQGEQVIDLVSDDNLDGDTAIMVEDERSPSAAIRIDSPLSLHSPEHDEEGGLKFDIKAEVTALDSILNETGSFSAPIEVNGTRVGKLTEEKIELEIKSITNAAGAKIAIAKPGKRLLRIGGRDIGRDGFQLTLPRKPCDAISIIFNSKGCRATANGIVFFQQSKDVTAEEEVLEATVNRIDAERKSKVQIAENDWHAMYMD